MSFFTHRRVRQETEFDRKARAIMHRVVTPTVALIASIAVSICCAWIFVVAFAGWPKVWARELIMVGLFIAPALAFVSVRELWCSGWNVRLFLAALLSGVGFAFLCATIYLAIHPHAA